MNQPSSLNEIAIRLTRLESTVDGFLGQLYSEGGEILEETIIEKVDLFAPVVMADVSMTPEQREIIVRRMCEKYGPDIDLGDESDGGGTVKTPYEPWLMKALRSEEITTKRWDAYKKFMRQHGRSNKSIQELDDSANKILDFAGDPRPSKDNSKNHWIRKGLVIGDVQSGKTQMFLGLANKAADAGYRVVVILSGNTEYLRRQTQERVDEGFIGQDSQSLGRAVNNVKETKNKPIGVRAFDRSNQSYGMTTVNYDFLQMISEAQNLPAVNADSPLPAVFVVKKNSYVLDALDGWAKRQAEENEIADVGFLLIDDESDYASVDTSKDGNDPTKINQAIRRLLTRFTRSSYVAITATPFANIFINHEAETKIDTETVRRTKGKTVEQIKNEKNIGTILVEDLFPSNYIHALKAPSNYVGLRKYFGTLEQTNDTNLRDIDDFKDVLPIRHKKDHVITHLPESLKTAIRSYFIANTIFDYRGNGNKPRSMLINVSKYTDVQNSLAELVRDFVANVQSQVENFGALDNVNHAIDEVGELYSTFKLDFANCGISWPDLKEHLLESSSGIRVKVYNSKPTHIGTDEEFSAEVPERQIAIGGDLLSRGLTLNNLIVSYFHRRPMAVDTLMQMARWFGYRDGYFDIVRVWISEQNVIDYRNTERAISHLKSQLREMGNNLREPSQFGLVVATKPELLAISAANKLRHSVKKPLKVNLNGERLETAMISKDIDTLRANQKAIANFIESIELNDNPAGDRIVQRGIDKRNVADLIRNFVISPFNNYMNSEILASAIMSATKDEYQTWDLTIMSGAKRNDDPWYLGGKRMPRLLNRKIEIRDDFYLVQGRNARLAGTHDLGYLLDDEVKKEMVVKYGRPVSKEDDYYPFLERPAIYLYLMNPLVRERPVKGIESDEMPKHPLDVSFVAGIKLAFPSDRDPGADDSDDGKALYWHNTVAQDLTSANYELD